MTTATSRPWGRTGILALAVVLLVGAFASSRDVSSAEQSLVAEFKDAGALEPGNDVRTAGVRVGSVKAIELKDGIARVQLSLDDSILPVHKDATVNIRPINVLGEGFLQLSPGTDSEPYLESGVIDTSHTSNSVTLQGVLDTLDNPTSTALAALVATLGEGVNQNGENAAAAIQALAPAMHDVDELGLVLSDQNQVLSQLVAQVDPVAKALATDNGRSMDHLVGSADKILTAVAANNQAVAQTLEQLPGTLAEARRTLRSLTSLSASATPVLKSLRPITGDLENVTSELQDFADAADPALASLKPVLDHADALLRQAAPVAATLDASGSDLLTTARAARPLGDQLVGQHLGDVMAFVRKWALSTNGRDGLSHYFRGVVHVTPASLGSLVGSPTNQGPTATKPNKAGGLLGGLTESLDSQIGGLLGLGSGATGLSPGQEGNLLSQLLGGL